MCCEERILLRKISKKLHSAQNENRNNACYFLRGTCCITRKTSCVWLVVLHEKQVACDLTSQVTCKYFFVWKGDLEIWNRNSNYLVQRTCGAKYCSTHCIIRCLLHLNVFGDFWDAFSLIRSPIWFRNPDFSSHLDIKCYYYRRFMRSWSWLDGEMLHLLESSGNSLVCSFSHFLFSFIQKFWFGLFDWADALKPCSQTFDEP